MITHRKRPTCPAAVVQHLHVPSVRPRRCVSDRGRKELIRRAQLIPRASLRASPYRGLQAPYLNGVSRLSTYRASSSHASRRSLRGPLPCLPIPTGVHTPLWRGRRSSGAARHLGPGSRCQFDRIRHRPIKRPSRDRVFRRSREQGPAGQRRVPRAYGFRGGNTVSLKVTTLILSIHDWTARN